MAIVQVLAAAGQYAGWNFAQSVWQSARATATQWWYNDTPAGYPTREDTYPAQWATPGDAHVYEVPASRYSANRQPRGNNYGDCANPRGHYDIPGSRRSVYEGPLGPPQFSFKPTGSNSWG